MIPQQRDLYAVNEGVYTGAFLAYIKTEFGRHYFLSMPSMECENIPEDVWQNGINKQIVERVDILPEEVYNICIAQYYKNEKLSFNRRE